MWHRTRIMYVENKGGDIVGQRESEGSLTPRPANRCIMVAKLHPDTRF